MIASLVTKEATQKLCTKKYRNDVRRSSFPINVCNVSSKGIPHVLGTHGLSGLSALRLCVRPHSLYPNCCPVYKPLQTASGEEICLRVNSPWWALTRAVCTAVTAARRRKVIWTKNGYQPVLPSQKHTDDVMENGAGVIAALKTRTRAELTY